MENQTSLVVGDETHLYRNSRGIEEYAHDVFVKLMLECGHGVLKPLSSWEEQKVGQDYSYLTSNREDRFSQRIPIEAKAETYARNHFYELFLCYPEEGTYEFGNAQKTTAHLMLYINFPGRYAILAKRVTWLDVALKLVLKSLSGADAKPLFGVLNGKAKLGLAAIGRQFPNATGRARTYQGKTGAELAAPALCGVRLAGCFYARAGCC